MIYEFFFSGKNPIESFLRSRLGLPESGFQYLAQSNSRPLGLVFSSICPLTDDFSFPFDRASDDVWESEMRHNSGLYIAILLRLPKVADQPCFISIFESFDAEYRAAVRKAKWACIGSSKPERVLTKIINALTPSLTMVEDRFTNWAVENRAGICECFQWIIDNKELTCNGNVEDDLSTMQPAWFTRL